MRIIAKRSLVNFWEKHPDSEVPIRTWYAVAKSADWTMPSDVKCDFASASILKDGRVVFNIHGNTYRLVVWVNYAYRVVYIRFIGTHADYDHIDAQTI